MNEGKETSNVIYVIDDGSLRNISNEKLTLDIIKNGI